MIHAVLTGDLVESSRAEGAEKNRLIESLKDAFKTIESWESKADGNAPSFDIFRGDSFQGVLTNARNALKAGILIRAALRKNQISEKDTNWDTRLAIGIGTIDHLPENISEGDGPAYRNSGPVLDALTGDHRLAIKTPWENVNEELKASCPLLDAVIAKWTAPQAEIIWQLLHDKKAKTIAEELDISPAAVHYRVKGASWFAIEAMLQRFTTIIENHTET